jgi:ABC-2 type transport system permease protein
MKLLDITLKDLRRSLRSRTIYFFAIGLPIFTALLFYFAFSGLSEEDGGIELPITNVVIVNHDTPQLEFGYFSAGQLLTELLMSEELSDLLNSRELETEASAREAIDAQEAGVAIIVPEGYTSKAFDPEGTVDITIFQDPTLSIGPAIVRSIVFQFVDSFAGAIISVDVVGDQLEARGIEATSALLQLVTQDYSTWAQSMSQQQADGTSPYLTIEQPPSERQESDLGTELITQMMSGMLIFYSFFTGANVAQSILQEHEEGTLARLFSTPTSRAAILGGKFFTVFVTTAGQIIVTLIATTLMFNIEWGDPLLLSFAVLALVLLSSSFGILIMSFLKTTRQAGPVIGVVLTLSGMGGGLFTSAMPSVPAAFDTVTLFTPQGWNHKIWKLAMESSGLEEMILPLIVVVVMGAVFFVIGSLVFRKRFA